MRFFGPIRTLIFAALLWLPLAFFVWFAFARAMVSPVYWIADSALTGLAGDLIQDLTWMRDFERQQTGSSDAPYYQMLVLSKVEVDGGLVQSTPGQRVPFDYAINPMIFGYSIPLFLGLVMATPLLWRQRLLQLAIGLPVLWLGQAWGVYWDALQTLAFAGGPDGLKAVTGAGYSTNLIALCYQLGALIFPAVLPILLWIGLNRSFIELLTSTDQDDLDALAEEAQHGRR